MENQRRLNVLGEFIYKQLRRENDEELKQSKPVDEPKAEQVVEGAGKRSHDSDNEGSNSTDSSFTKKMKASGRTWDQLRDDFKSTISGDRNKEELNIDETVSHSPKLTWADRYDKWQRRDDKTFQAEVTKVWKAYNKAKSKGGKVLEDYIKSHFEKYQYQQKFPHIKEIYVMNCRELLLYDSAEAVVDLELYMRDMQELQSKANLYWTETEYYDQLSFLGETVETGSTMDQGEVYHYDMEQEGEQKDEYISEQESSPQKEQQQQQQQQQNDEVKIEYDELGNPIPFHMPFIANLEDAANVDGRDLKRDTNEPKYTNAANCSCRFMTEATREAHFRKFPFRGHLERLSNRAEFAATLRRTRNEATSRNNKNKDKALKKLDFLEKMDKNKLTLREMAAEIEDEVHMKLGCFQLPDMAGNYERQLPMDDIAYEILKPNLRNELSSYYPVMTGADGNCMSRVSYNS